MGWSADYPDPVDWYHLFLTTSSNNVAFYQNQQYDNFVRVARTDTQPDRRDQEYQQAQQMLVGDAPVAFLAQTVSWHLVRQYVRESSRRQFKSGRGPWIRGRSPSRRTKYEAFEHSFAHHSLST